MVAGVLAVDKANIKQEEIDDEWQVMIVY